VGHHHHHAGRLVFLAGNLEGRHDPPVRANPGGTGWIKSDANYVTSALAKREAESAGFMEAVFLDAREHSYFEEGSSCNIFFVMKSGAVVTPSLEDTILPGITRKSVLILAREAGLATEERRISVAEAFAQARECFVTGTAAGISYIESITHEGKEAVFCGRKMGEVTHALLKTLKGFSTGGPGRARLDVPSHSLTGSEEQGFQVLRDRAIDLRHESDTG